MTAVQDRVPTSTSTSRSRTRLPSSDLVGYGQRRDQDRDRDGYGDGNGKGNDTGTDTGTDSDSPQPRLSRRTTQLVLGRQGRGPWYDAAGQSIAPYLIAVAGGSASGKTSVARRIVRAIDAPSVVIISQDSFYNELTQAQKDQAARNEYDFDTVSAFDWHLLRQRMRSLIQGKMVKIPVYDFKTHSRLARETTLVYGASVIIFEGIFALYDPELIEMMDLRLFVDCDADTRLARRIQRDIVDRGRALESVLDQYFRYVKPSQESFVQPSAKNADLIMPRGLDNNVAIDLVTRHIRNALEDRNIEHRQILAQADVRASQESKGSATQVPANVTVLEQTPQLIGVHTIVRDVTTSRADFLFYSKRLGRLVLERALAALPTREKKVKSPTGHVVCGLDARMEDVCGISIARGGGMMEEALRKIDPSCALGSLLIQSGASGEPSLYFLSLPEDIASKSLVLLMDAQLATGAATLMAIRVLLDWGVKESAIKLCVLLAAPQGLHTISRAFPEIGIVVSAIDQGLQEGRAAATTAGTGEEAKEQTGDEILDEGEGEGKRMYAIMPGLGQFSDRFYGT